MRIRIRIIITILAIVAVSVGVGLVLARRESVNPIVVGGPHPYVKGWYYKARPRAFQCESDPYDCKECPVGKPDRVITVNDTYVAPAQVNSFFGCDDINRLVPEKGYADGDVFICHREPEDGSIMLNGRIVRCGGTK